MIDDHGLDAEARDVGLQLFARFGQLDASVKVVGNRHSRELERRYAGPSAGHPEVHVALQLPVHAVAPLSPWQWQNDFARLKFSRVGSVGEECRDVERAYPE